MKIQDVPNSEELRYAFQILSSEVKSFIVYAGSDEEKADWIQSFEPYAAKSLDFSLPIWLPDTSTDKCLSCDKSFSFINRKHHCRLYILLLNLQVF